MKPRVSVLLPCYNSEKFVAEAINSILEQTFRDFELIIIDDGSTDKSAEIIQSFKDDRIVYVNNGSNIGLIKTLNKGLDIVSGEYIARMDSDDIALPQRFERQIQFLDSHSEVGVVGTWMHWFPGDERQGDGSHAANITYLDLLLRGWCVNHPTVMMRKSVLDCFQLRYDENYPCAEDYELWTRFIRFARIANLQEILLKYRWHSDNISATKEDIMKKSVHRVQQNMLDFLTADPQVREGVLDLKKDNPAKNITLTEKVLASFFRLLGIKGLHSRGKQNRQFQEKNLGEHIPVFLSSDENYAPMVAITIISAMEHTTSAVDFYVLSDCIAPESQQKIINCTRRFRHCTVEFIPVDMRLFYSFEMPESYLNKTSYMRLLIPQIKPELKKVIFSDVDVIFMGDIAEIYNENLDGKIIAVVPDVYYQMNHNAIDIYGRLDLPPEHQYFYAGMILMDAAKWRAEDVTQKIFTLAKKFSSRIKQAEQDLLNIYFACNYKELDPKYEVTNLLIKYRKRLDKAKQKSIAHPIIRHYESKFKPWNSKYFQEDKMQDFNLFWKYAKKTPFYKRLKEEFNRAQ